MANEQDSIIGGTVRTIDRDPLSGVLAVDLERSLMPRRKVKSREVRLADRTLYLNRRKQLDRQEGPAVIWSDGSTEWWSDGRRHRDDGPAIERADGAMSWFRHGSLHRSDGPAYIDRHGHEEWWQDGKLHRGDGPALIDSSGLRLWYVDGRLHCESGPAAIRADGSEEYWFRGHQLLAGAGQTLDVAGCTIWFSCGVITILNDDETSILREPPRPQAALESNGVVMRRRQRAPRYQPKQIKHWREKP